jgi:hypothetical protein
MKDAMCLAIDLKNAVGRGPQDNFTVLLFRLMLKSDSENTAKLARGFPVEAKMIALFRCGCPYLADGEVDFVKLAKMACENGEI